MPPALFHINIYPTYKTALSRLPFGQGLASSLRFPHISSLSPAPEQSGKAGRTGYERVKISRPRPAIRPDRLFAASSRCAIGFSRSEGTLDCAIIKGSGAVLLTMNGLTEISQFARSGFLPPARTSAWKYSPNKPINRPCPYRLYPALRTKAAMRWQALKGNARTPLYKAAALDLGEDDICQCGMRRWRNPARLPDDYQWYCAICPLATRSTAVNRPLTG